MPVPANSSHQQDRLDRKGLRNFFRSPFCDCGVGIRTGMDLEEAILRNDLKTVRPRWKFSTHAGEKVIGTVISAEGTELQVNSLSILADCGSVLGRGSPLISRCKNHIKKIRSSLAIGRFLHKRSGGGCRFPYAG